MYGLCTAKSLVVGAVFAAGIVLVSSASASADARINTDEVMNGVRISASCVSNINDGQAVWTVTNPSEEPVNLTWTTAAAGGHTGTFTAPSGDSQLKTGFEPTEADTPYVFTQDDQADQTLVASTDACQTETPAPVVETEHHEGNHHHEDEEVTCVDGSNRNNLVFDWNQNGTVSLHTKNDALLCEDVTVFLSSYTLPDTYSQSGIFDDSSLPQNLFDSSSVVMKAGTNGNVTLTTKVPNACTNYQLDVYYAPEITLVDGPGHGKQLIYGKIYSKTQDDCPAPVPVVVPPTIPQVLGDTTPAPAPVTTPHILASATVLTNTGVQVKTPMILALFITGTALLVTRLNFARKQQ